MFREKYANLIISSGVGKAGATDTVMAKINFKNLEAN